MSEVVSSDGRTITDRADWEGPPAIQAALAQLPPAVRTLAEAAGKGWAQSTMTYQGACPVKLGDDQPFVIVRPDDTILDPSQATGCMVAVLKTVDGVIAPSAGFVRDPGKGPLPFVRYTYPSRHGAKATVVTFTADGDGSDPETWQYVAKIGGLFSPSDRGPDTYGADGITKLWKDRCAVDANILFP